MLQCHFSVTRQGWTSDAQPRLIVCKYAVMVLMYTYIGHVHLPVFGNSNKQPRATHYTSARLLTGELQVLGRQGHLPDCVWHCGSCLWISSSDFGHHQGIETLKYLACAAM